MDQDGDSNDPNDKGQIVSQIHTCKRRLLQLVQQENFYIYGYNGLVTQF